MKKNFQKSLPGMKAKSTDTTRRAAPTVANNFKVIIKQLDTATQG